MPFFASLESETVNNYEFRKILFTAQDDKFQIVAQCLNPGQTVPYETHPHTTQMVLCEEGAGFVTFHDTNYTMIKGTVIVIPANTRHEISNPTTKYFKFVTIYNRKEHDEHDK